MRFMIIIRASADSEAEVMPSEKVLIGMGTFNEEMGKAGILLAAEGLRASSKGARVKLADGKKTVTDGPFAETKELIAGFWLVQLKSLDEAKEWVKRLPVPDSGEINIEIRQVAEFEDLGDALTPEVVQVHQETHPELRAAQKKR